MHGRPKASSYLATRNVSGKLIYIIKACIPTDVSGYYCRAVGVQCHKTVNINLNTVSTYQRAL